MNHTLPTLLLGAALLAGCSAQKPQTDELLMFTGSYAPADSAGVRSFIFNQQTGEWSALGAMSGISNPSFITVDTARSKIYSVGEDAGNSSTINVVNYCADGAMTLAATDTTGGGAPCHITLTPDESSVVTANYMGGSITIYNLDADGLPEGSPRIIRFTGKGPDSARQSQPHIHQITFTPDASAMLANDLGTDKIHILPYPFTGDSIADIEMKPGSGPRHTTFCADGRHAYMLSEISGEVTAFAVDGNLLTPIQTIAADTVGAQGAADIHISPDGRHLYASLRLAADGLAIFTIDPTTGTLTRIGHQPTGPHPRNFAITPNGKYILVACRDSNEIEVYERNSATGRLTLRSAIPTSRPTCIALIASEKK